jgi:hypothetical protein
LRFADQASIQRTRTACQRCRHGGPKHSAAGTRGYEAVSPARPFPVTRLDGTPLVALAARCRPSARRARAWSVAAARVHWIPISPFVREPKDARVHILSA